MEDLSTYTPIELQKMLNDIKEQHEQTKKMIADDTYKIEELETEINKKITLLTELEKQYVFVIEEIDKR